MSSASSYGKIASKIIEQLEEIPKSAAQAILNFVAECRGIDSPFSTEADPGDETP